VVTTGGRHGAILAAGMRNERTQETACPRRLPLLGNPLWGRGATPLPHPTTVDAAMQSDQDHLDLFRLYLDDGCAAPRPACTSCWAARPSSTRLEDLVGAA
jgi:hypothetical protein